MEEQTEQEQLPFIDGGQVLIMVGDPQTGKMMPIPLPAVFEQLFGVLGDMDRRIQELEAGRPAESRIIKV